MPNLKTESENSHHARSATRSEVPISKSYFCQKPQQISLALLNTLSCKEDTYHTTVHFGFAFGKFQIVLCAERQCTDARPEKYGKICRRRTSNQPYFENVQ
jgi:hypothetical protein